MFKCRCIFFSHKVLKKVFHFASSYDLDTINLIFVPGKRLEFFCPIFYFILFAFKLEYFCCFLLKLSIKSYTYYLHVQYNTTYSTRQLNLHIYILNFISFK